MKGLFTLKSECRPISRANKNEIDIDTINDYVAQLYFHVRQIKYAFIEILTLFRVASAQAFISAHIKSAIISAVGKI